MRQFYFLMLLCSSIIAVNAQNYDSLTKVSLKEGNDSLAVLQTVRNGFTYLYANPDTAALIFEQIKTIAQRSKDPIHWSRYYNTLGIVKDVKGESNKALAFYEKALIKANEGASPQKEIMQAQILNNMGLIYWNKALLDEAIEFYFKALRIFEKLSPETIGTANTLSNIAVIYDEIGNLEKSAIYHRKALAKRIEFKDNRGIGVSYTNLSVLAAARGKIDSALYYSRQALHYKKQQNDQYGMGLSYINLGNHHRNYGTKDSALFYFNKARVIFQKQENYHRVGVCLSAIGAIYTDIGLYSLANQNIDSALVLAEKAEAKSVIVNALLRGARLDSLQGNANRAYGRLRAARELESEIFNLEKEELISSITSRYEVAKKEKELAENKAALAEEKLIAKQRGFWLWLLALSILLLAAIAIFVYRQQKLRQKALRAEARLKERLAAAELNKSLEEERVRISRDLHDHIGAQLTIISSQADQLAYKTLVDESKLKLSQIADYSRDTMAQLRETIWAMNNRSVNLEMLKAKLAEFTQRFNNSEQKITVTLSASNPNSELGPTKTINVYRVCQEAVNNAVKYAQFSQLSIDLQQKGNDLEITISDNGIGFNSLNESSKGYGLASMKQRLEEVNGQFDLKSSPESGTVIILSLRLGILNTSGKRSLAHVS